MELDSREEVNREALPKALLLLAKLEPGVEREPDSVPLLLLLRT